MLRHLLSLLTSLSLTAASLDPPAYNNTNPRFFNDSMRCNCRDNQPCDSSGVCAPDRCARPYVGVTCQHADVSLLWTNTTKAIPELTDGDDSTCTNPTFDGVFSYALSHPAYIFWAYVYPVVFNDQTVMPDLHLYKNESRITNAQISTLNVNQNAVLMKLVLPVLYDSLELTNLPSNTCTVEVGLGRNLALTSEPIQSSFRSKESNYPRLATDGLENRDSPMCSHTSQTTATEWWSTRLAHNSRVNLVVLLNGDESRCLLKGFTLEMFSENGTVEFTYSDASVKEQAEYQIAVATQALVRELKVSVNQYNQNIKGCKTYGMLSLCEVLVFGEPECPPDMYGPLCNIHCTVCSNEICDPDWGCPEGCQDKWKGFWCFHHCYFRYGSICQWDCSDNCAGHGDCHSDTGACHEGCKAGYRSSDCSETCALGTFGERCAETCSSCRRNETTGDYMCDAVGGYCKGGCDQGFAGDRCERIRVVGLLDSAVAKISLAVGVFVLGIMFLRGICGPSIITRGDDSISQDESACTTALDVTAPGSSETSARDTRTSSVESIVGDDLESTIESPTKTRFRSSRLFSLSALKGSFFWNKGQREADQGLEASSEPQIPLKEFVTGDQPQGGTGGGGAFIRKALQIVTPAETEQAMESSDKANPSTVLRTILKPPNDPNTILKASTDPRTIPRVSVKSNTISKPWTDPNTVTNPTTEPKAMRKSITYLETTPKSIMNPEAFGKSITDPMAFGKPIKDPMAMRKSAMDPETMRKSIVHPETLPRMSVLLKDKRSHSPVSNQSSAQTLSSTMTGSSKPKMKTSAPDGANSERPPHATSPPGSSASSSKKAKPGKRSHSEKRQNSESGKGRKSEKWLHSESGKRSQSEERQIVNPMSLGEDFYSMLRTNVWEPLNRQRVNFMASEYDRQVEEMRRKSETPSQRSEEMK